MSSSDEQKKLDDLLNLLSELNPNNGELKIDKTFYQKRIIVTCSFSYKFNSLMISTDLHAIVDFEIDDFIEIFNNKFPNKKIDEKQALIELAIIPHVFLKHAFIKDYNGLADKLHDCRGRIVGVKFNF